MTSTVALAPPSPKTYLQQCSEDLAPAVISSFQTKSTLWQVASVATLVAFSVLAVSSFCAVGIFAPIYVPIAGLTAVLLLRPVNKAYKLFELWSDEAHARAEQLKDIKSHYLEISPLNSVQLQLNLQQKGIFLSTVEHSPADLQTLKPLIARHQFWEGHVRDIQTKIQGKLNEATRLTTGNRAEIYELRCHALELEKQALEAKVKNAFISAVIRRPAFAGTPEDIGTFSKLSAQERAIGNAVNTASVNEFFTFKRSGFAALTADEVKRLTVAELGTRLIAAM